MTVLAASLVTGVALVLLPWATIAWGRRLARRAPPATPISRWTWRLLILIPLVPLGAYLLVGHFVMTWGWPAAIWFLGAPALRGLLQRRDA